MEIKAINIAFNETGTSSYLGDASVTVYLLPEILSQDVATKSAQVRFKFVASSLNNAFYKSEQISSGGYLEGKCSYIAVNGVEAPKGFIPSLDGYEYVQGYYGGGKKRTRLTGGSYLGPNTGKWYQNLSSSMTLWSSDPYTFYYDENDSANVSVNITLNFELYKTAAGSDSSYPEPDGSDWYAKVEGVQFSTNFDLPALPRYAVISSAPNFTDEETPTISYVVPIGTTNIEVGILDSNSNVIIDYRAPENGDKSGSYTFNFTQDERQKFWKILEQGLSSTKVYFAIKSYYAPTNTDYLKLTAVKTLTIVNYMPTIEPVLWDFNPVTVALTTGAGASTTEGGANTSYKVVKYFSEVAYDDKAEAYKGASIASRLIVNGDRRNTLINGTFDNIVSSLFTFTATDTFGRTTPEAYYELAPTNWVEYIKLSCSIKLSEMAADGDVEVTATGKYFNGSFGAQNNTITFTYTAAPSRGTALTGTATNVSFSIDDNNNYTAVFTIPNLSYTDSYSISVTATDKLMSATSGSSVVAPEPIFDWGRYDFNFNVPVTIQGGSVPTIQAQGTSGIWTYRTWSDGTAECWGKKDVSVTFPQTANWGGLYTTGAISGSNISFPFGLFAETPVVNASLLIRSAGGILMAPGGAGSNIANWDQTGVYEIARGSYVSGAQAYTINYQVIGRWK